MATADLSHQQDHYTVFVFVCMITFQYTIYCNVRNIFWDFKITSFHVSCSFCRNISDLVMGDLIGVSILSWKEQNGQG